MTFDLIIMKHHMTMPCGVQKQYGSLQGHLASCSSKSNKTNPEWLHIKVQNIGNSPECSNFINVTVRIVNSCKINMWLNCKSSMS